MQAAQISASGGGRGSMLRSNERLSWAARVAPRATFLSEPSPGEPAAYAPARFAIVSKKEAGARADGPAAKLFAQR